jgi:hypothetical protein
MITVRHAWIGLLILLLVALLVLAAAVYWQHVTGVTALHLLAFVPNLHVSQGC